MKVLFALKEAIFFVLLASSAVAFAPTSTGLGRSISVSSSPWANKRATFRRRLVEEDEMMDLSANPTDGAKANSAANSGSNKNAAPRIPGATFVSDPISLLLISGIAILVADDFLHFMPEGGVGKAIASVLFPGQQN